MSQSHLKKRKQSSQRVVRLRIALGLTSILFLLLVLYVPAHWVYSFPSAHKTATARVLEVRKVFDHTQDSLYGGKIIYRAEAHVQYLVDGQMQDRWLHCSDDLTQEGLLLKLAAHPTESIVYWSPNHPENAKCSLR